MTEHEELKRNIEQAVLVKQELHRLKREIFDLRRDIDYIEESNLEYYNKDIRIRLSESEMQILVENREQMVNELEAKTTND